MKKFLVFAMVAIFASVAMANEVTNPGFETAGGGGSWDPADWTRTDGVWRNDANPRTGDWHLSIDATQDPAAVQFVTGLSGWAGLDITASMWVNVTGGNAGNVFFGVNQREGDGTWISNHETSFIWGTTGYEQFTLDFEGAANLGQIEVYFRTTEVDARRWDIDDVSLTAIPEPATMSLLGLGALAMVLRRKIKK
jgi:hypothetical protein